MRLRWAGLGGALVIVAGVASAPAPARALGMERPASGRADLSGHWKLNKELSDDEPAYAPAATPGPAAGQAAEAEPADRESGGGRGGGGGRGRTGRTGQPGAAGAVDDDPRGARRSQAAEELTVTQTEPEVVVEEKPGRTRNFYPDGRTYKADEGLADVKAEWREGALVVEKKTQQGWKLTETWQLAPDRNRLRIDLRLEGGNRPKRSLKRVYDRAEPPGH